MKPSLLIALSCALLGTQAYATGNDSAAQRTPATAPVTLTNSNGENAQWTGIGRLSLAGKRCIGTLLDTHDALAGPNGPAYVLTAGHCAGGVNGKILVDQPVEGSIQFNYFTDTVQKRHTRPLKRTVWNSTQGADLALLELDATLDELLALGITPLKLGASPASGAAVWVIGEPSASTDNGLRLSKCSEWYAPTSSVGSWVWRNVRNNDCQGLGTGVSGSPVFDPNLGRLTSVINSLQGDEAGSIPVHRISGCFAAGQVDLGLDGCNLVPGFQLEQRPDSAFKTSTKARTLDDGTLQPATWNFAFNIDTPRYRYKLAADALACEEPTGYSGTILASEALINDAVGPEPGTHYLCLMGVQSADQRPSHALMANSLSIALKLLPPGKPTAQVTREAFEDGNISLSWHKEPGVLFYRVKRGAPDTTDCEDPAGYRLLRQEHIVVKASKLPLKVCSVAIDLIEQRSAYRTDLLEESGA
jgi:hypothetical protein